MITFRSLRNPYYFSHSGYSQRIRASIPRAHHRFIWIILYNRVPPHRPRNSIIKSLGTNPNPNPFPIPHILRRPPLHLDGNSAELKEPDSKHVQICEQCQPKLAQVRMRKRVPSPALRPNASPKRLTMLLAVVMNAVTVVEPARLNSTPIIEKARLLYMIARLMGRRRRPESLKRRTRCRWCLGCRTWR